MPRANRYFLPGYVWHITTNAEASSIVQTVQPLRSVQNVLQANTKAL